MYCVPESIMIKKVTLNTHTHTHTHTHIHTLSLSLSLSSFLSVFHLTITLHISSWKKNYLSLYFSLPLSDTHTHTHSHSTFVVLVSNDNLLVASFTRNPILGNMIKSMFFFTKWPDLKKGAIYRNTPALKLFFFKGWWHLVAFIFTRSYLFTRL